MSVTGPPVTRRQLGRRLRALRDAAGMKMPDIAATKIISTAKLYRIENGTTAVKVPDVWALCRIYGADDKTTDALAALAASSNEKDWWHDYGDIMPADFELYLGLEAAASEIRIYEPERVHGLFQTSDYAREIEQATNIDIALPLRGETVERYVALRMERQKTVLDRTPPCRIVAVLGAGALARQVGGERTMAEQIERLRELARLDQVEIRVLPFSIGAHAAMGDARCLRGRRFRRSRRSAVCVRRNLFGCSVHRGIGATRKTPGSIRVHLSAVGSNQGVQDAMSTTTEWVKARRSSNGGSCVEVRRHAGMIEIRDSKDQSGPVLRFTNVEWDAFLDGARGREFDHLLAD